MLYPSILLHRITFTTKLINIFAVKLSCIAAIIGASTSAGAIPTDHVQANDDDRNEPSPGSVPNKMMSSIDIQFRDTQLGAVHYNDYTYHKTGESKGISYYRCAQKRTADCRANIKVLSDGHIARNRIKHNHQPKKSMKSTSILANKKLIFNGYGFHKHFVNKRKTHWRCTNIKLTKCNVRLHTDNLGNIQFIRGVHNHEPNV